MHVDVAIIGGGIAGLGCAAHLAARAQVVVIESEPTLGFHATGRSAAAYTECYGAEPVRRLAQASKHYFVDSDEPLSISRAVLFVAAHGMDSTVEQVLATFSPLVPTLQRLSPDEIADLVDVLPPDLTAGGVLEPGALDLDVHAILTSFVAEVRALGGAILTNSPVTKIVRIGDMWKIRAGDDEVTAATLVNAAGAWGDHIAELAGIEPLGLVALKRSAFTFDAGVDAHDWPLVVDADEQWYMKPEGPHVLGSAASEILEEPTDARHDEIDIALGIERINGATTLAIRSIKNQWAGFRTFTPDRIPALGFASGADGFFWLVGQGGYGIKTSPAMGAMAAGLILDNRVPDKVAQFGVTREMLDPRRFDRSPHPSPPGTQAKQPRPQQ